MRVTCPYAPISNHPVAKFLRCVHKIKGTSSIHSVGVGRARIKQTCSPWHLDGLGPKCQIIVFGPTHRIVQGQVISIFPHLAAGWSDAASLIITWKPNGPISIPFVRSIRRLTLLRKTLHFIVLPYIKAVWRSRIRFLICLFIHGLSVSWHVAVTNGKCVSIASFSSANCWNLVCDSLGRMLQYLMLKIWHLFSSNQ